MHMYTRADTYAHVHTYVPSHAYMCTRVRTRIHAHIRAHTSAHIRMYTHTRNTCPWKFIHIHARAHTLVCTHSYTCTHTHAYTYTCTRTCPHIPTRAHAYTYAHVHIHTRVHTCTPTHSHMHACTHTRHSQTKESQRPVCTPARATAQGTCRTRQGEITLARLPTAHLPSTALASRLFVHSSGVTPLKDHGSFSKALSLAKERPDSLYRTGANPRRGSISPPRHSLPVCPRKQGWVGG